MLRQTPGVRSKSGYQGPRADPARRNVPDGGNANGPQVGGGLTRWHSHMEVCRGNRIIVAGFNVALRGQCDPSTWKDTYTTQMLHVWVVPYRRGLLRRPEHHGDDHRRPRPRRAFS